MAPTVTLTSLAMLKVNIDQGRDYLDYLRPFILQVLVDNEPDPVTDQGVHDLIQTHFGLDIPTPTVQIVLKRLSRTYPLKREEGVYHITRKLPNPGIQKKKSEAVRHMQAVINGLIEFSLIGTQQVISEEEAAVAIAGFLSEFNIFCLQAYSRGTAIPTVSGKQDRHIVLVSEYVLHLQRNDPERFDSFIIMVQGHMLANALLCPDLQNAPRSYKRVRFFLDTPLLVQQLGLDGEPKKRAIEELTALVRKLGGTVAIFSHSREELIFVLKGAAEHVGKPGGRSVIVRQAWRNGTTKSDLLLLADKANKLLLDARIDVVNTPPYVIDFQIDQSDFEKILDDEVSYFNPRAREYDINSVRSIYVLRAGAFPDTIERSKAVLVSSNAGLAQAASEYSRRHEGSLHVSSVITDFSLANMAWLKVPMGAPSVPMTEVLAYSYAALQPTQAFLDRFLAEIDKLQKQGKISERDHQILRSSPFAQDELMRFTLGEEAALTEETVTETLRRVTHELKKEEIEKLTQEQVSHRKTLDELAATKGQNESLQKRLYWKSRRKSLLCAWCVSCAMGILLVLGVVAGFGLHGRHPILGWLLLGGVLFLAVATLVNVLFGTTVRQVHAAIQSRCLTFFLRHESKATGIDFGATE